MYILRVSCKAFIKVEQDGVVVTPDYNKATTFSTIGSAMREAARINSEWESVVAKVISLKTP